MSERSSLREGFRFRVGWCHTRTVSPSPSGSALTRRRRGRKEAAGWHVHWFRRVGDDPYSSASLYACRCGVVRPGL